LHFEEWAKSCTVYQARFAGDPLEGKKVEWNGYSNPVQYFLQEHISREGRDLLHDDEFEQCFAEAKADISVSYVWASTKLEDIAGMLGRMLLMH
jgi:hypothetical protein